MALYKYHYIELDTKRSPRISLQNIVAGETGNRLLITVTNNGETVDMSEKSNGEFIYRVCLKIDSDLGTRRQDSAMENSGITFIEANTGDHGKINILLSKDSFTAGMNRARIEIFSKRAEDNDTLIISAEWTFRAARNPTGENRGVTYPLMAYYEQLAKSWAVGGTGKREGENTDNAKYYKDLAEQAVQGGIIDPTFATWLNAHMSDFITAIGNDADGWLSEHITNPSNPPLDTSLSLANAAAPANLVGNIKKNVDGLQNTLISPFKESAWEQGRLSPTSGQSASSAGTIVIDGVTNTVYAIRLKDYLENDIIAISCEGNAYPVLFAYTDSYVGYLKDGSFVNSGAPSVTSSDRFINIQAIRAANPTYKFKIVVYDSSATSSAPNVSTLINSVKYFTFAVTEKELAEQINRSVQAIVRWENGKLSSTGQPSSTGNANQIRTNEFVKINSDSFTLTVGAGYVAQYYIYDATQTFVSRSSNVREKTVVVPITKGYYIKLTAFNTAQSAISPYEANNIALTYMENVIETEADTNAVEDYASVSLFESMGVVGDSFASGVLYDPLTNDYIGTNYNLSWGQIMGRDHGISVTNFSEGGLYTKTWLSDTDHGLTALLAANPLKLYVIALGINDARAITDGDMTLGTIADVNVSDYTLNPDSFYGNYGRIIGNILNHAPNAKIVCLSVAREGQRNMDEHINAIATKYKIPYVNLTNDLYFTSATFYGSFANGHPLAYGYAGMAKAITRLIERSIQQNQYYFSSYYGA